MTWRDVLECKRAGVTQDRHVEVALAIGYRFIAFNGRIYFVCREGDEPRCHDTGLDAAGLDGKVVEADELRVY